MPLRCKNSRCGVKSETAVFVRTEKLLTAVMVVRSSFYVRPQKLNGFCGLGYTLCGVAALRS